MAMMVFRTCQQVEGGLPTNVMAMMMFNIIVDFFIGLVPFLGDIADALFRANTKNAALLEAHLRKKGAAKLKAQGSTAPTVDPSDPDEFDRMMNSKHGTPPVYTTDAPSQQAPMRQTGPSRGSQRQPQTTTTNTTAPTTTQKSGGGWFSRFGGKSKQPDIESGVGHGRDDAPLSTLPAQQPARRPAH